MNQAPTSSSLKQRLRAVPVLGYAFAWANSLLRLPATRDRNEVVMADLRAENQRLQERLAALENARPAPPAMDRFYLEFENRFRGSREDIKNRLTVYLPRLAHLRTVVGSARATAPIAVDVGCGRGEWLELMAEQGIPALGIDSNSAMVQACLDRGHAAQCDDAIAFLQRQPAGSLALITGFHIIEHLPFETLIALFDAASHALRPDGCVIFETPNPENLRVGACSFYTDPTHISPIVPEVAQFMAEQRGFAQAEILRLHPNPEHERLAASDATAVAVNQALFGARDYAVIAWKAVRP